MKLDNLPYRMMIENSFWITMVILTGVVIYSGAFDQAAASMNFIKKALVVIPATVLVAFTAFSYREHRQATREKDAGRIAQLKQSLFTVVLINGAILVFNIFIYFDFFLFEDPDRRFDTYFKAPLGKLLREKRKMKQDNLNMPYKKMLQNSLWATCIIIAGVLILYARTPEQALTALQSISKAMTAFLAILVVTATVFLYSQRRQALRENDAGRAAKASQAIFNTILVGGGITVMNIAIFLVISHIG